jgi:hypothetical protein
MSSSAAPAPPATAMRFHVDAWDPSYGASADSEVALDTSESTVVTSVERDDADWRPIGVPPGGPLPAAVLFVDGVRRIDARVWIDDPDVPDTAAAAVCASYAAGVICCCDGRAHLLAADRRRGLFSAALHAADIDTWAGTYTTIATVPERDTPLLTALSLKLQRELSDVEVETAHTARAELAGHGVGDGDDLLVVDGPLKSRTHLPRALGYVKTHHSQYLPAALHAMVGRLGPGERTPVFLVNSGWDRYSWYLRLPCRPGAPWAGVVRVEASTDLKPAEAIGLASQSQLVLCKYASSEFKDPRAPQNLYPIAGLEKELRRRLGDPRLMYRALRSAAS